MTASFDDCGVPLDRDLFHEDAVALLAHFISPVMGVEQVSVYAASRRVSTEAVFAPRPIPAHTNSAVDGYAFDFRTYDAARGTVFPIDGRSAPGEGFTSLRCEANVAIRIFTGAVMPQGCDTVAMQEDCRLEGDASVFIPAGLNRSANRRVAGEDMARGQRIVAAGQRLRPQDVSAVAATGRSHVDVFRKPRIGIFSTGNEVLPLTAPFRDGCVYDANGPMLAGLFQPLAVEVSFQGILPDSREDVRRALESAASHHDLIITSGGASVGEEDHVIGVLKEECALRLWRLAIKPGRPVGVGRIGACFCVALPGNPVAGMVGALLYAWPTIRRLSGEEWIEPPRLVLPAGFEIRSRKQGRREFLRGWLENANGKPLVKRYENDGSGLISSLCAASGLIEILENRPSVGEGEAVNFIPFSAFGIL